MRIQSEITVILYGSWCNDRVPFRIIMVYFESICWFALLDIPQYERVFYHAGELNAF